MTDGDSGGFDPGVPRAEIPGIRRTEQTAVAKAVGVSDVMFLGYPDGRLVSSLQLRRDLACEIRRVLWNASYAPSPARNWQLIVASHSNHLAASEAALAACTGRRNPFAHPELLADGYERWTVLEVWMTEAPVRDRWVDITEVLPRKLDALRNHVSQHTDADGKVEERMRAGARSSREAGSSTASSPKVLPDRQRRDLTVRVCPADVVNPVDGGPM